MVSFDTNILVYAADRTAGNRHLACARLLTAAASTESALNEQSLFEFIYASTRKRKQPLRDATLMVRAWLKNFALLVTPTTIVEDSLALMSAYQLQIWDARMLSVCAANGCDVLLSEDMTDGALYGRVRVLNPFNPANTSILTGLLHP
jgi:predicted nucleic acid-binding protein